MSDAESDLPEGALITSRVSIARVLYPDGQDIVAVDLGDTKAIEALGMLHMALDYVLHPPAEEDE